MTLFKKLFKSFPLLSNFAWLFYSVHDVLFLIVALCLIDWTEWKGSLTQVLFQSYLEIISLQKQLGYCNYFQNMKKWQINNDKFNKLNFKGIPLDPQRIPKATVTKIYSVGFNHDFELLYSQKDQAILEIFV